VSLGSLDSLRGLAVLVVVIVSAIVSVDLECVE
jgi:peptidoglycan/LPS O-acetylase OafA/YrhL